MINRVQLSHIVRPYTKTKQANNNFKKCQDNKFFLENTFTETLHLRLQLESCDSSTPHVLYFPPDKKGNSKQSHYIYKSYSNKAPQVHRTRWLLKIEHQKNKQQMKKVRLL